MAALEPTSREDFDGLGRCVILNYGLYPLPDPGSWVGSVALGNTMVLESDHYGSVFV